MSRHGHRFYVNSLLSAGQELSLPPDVAHQVHLVLRLEPGDQITVFNGDGREWSATLTAVSRKQVIVQLGEPSLGRHLPAPSITLGLALLKREHFEFVIQKATELGVQHIVPLLTERTVVRLDAQRESMKHSRWQRIAFEAAEQSGRTELPTITEPCPLDAIRSQLTTSLSLVCWEHETSQHLTTCRFPQDANIFLLVGPEGGWTEGEIQRLRSWGAKTISLGPLTLRSETAAITAIAMVQAAFACQHPTSAAVSSDVA